MEAKWAGCSSELYAVLRVVSVYHNPLLTLLCG
jgi:hypothetical protein